MSKVLISLYIIAAIESSFNPEAINHTTNAYGMYQITQPVLDDYNKSRKADFKLDDMLNPANGQTVSSWYLNTEIPRLLKHYGLEDSVEHRLASYNCGIGCLKKRGLENLPKETKNYITEYRRLKKEIYEN